MTKDRRLGKGLAALLGQAPEEEGPSTIPFDDATASSPLGAVSRKAPVKASPARLESFAATEAPVAEEGGDSEFRLPIDQIDANPFQPRREFGAAELAAMAESLKTHDMLQPVLVRKVGSRYQLISGERRLRAAKEAGWSSIPARIRDADDRLAAELAIVENLQRKDLNAIEKALSFKRYLDEHQCHQEDLARRLKIDRSTIANLVRLLELPDQVQAAIAGGEISAGHARALLPLGNEKQQTAFCKRIQSEGLSVRETERLVQEMVRVEDGAAPLESPLRGGRGSKSDQVAALEQQLRVALGCRVDIRQGSKGRGKLVIHFAGHEEFERVKNMLQTSAAGHKAA